MHDHILYIEDEIEILTILEIFGRVLSPEIRNELQQLNEVGQQTGRAVSPARVKEIVERSEMVRLEYRFPGALSAVVNDAEDFAVFIIDRNLGTSNYRDDELVLPTGVVFDAAKFENRQGDFILNYLLGRLKIDPERVFLHTANSRDQLRCVEDLATQIDMGMFSKDHILDKSKTGNDRLKDVVKHAQHINTVIENREECRVLKELLGEESLNQFYQVFENRNAKDRQEIGNNLSVLRNLVEAMVKMLAAKKQAPEYINDDRDRRHYLYDRQGQLQVSEAIKSWIKDNDSLRSNRMVVEFFLSIWGIGSAFGSHHDEEVFQPTANTVISLIYALKELLLWFDEVLQEPAR